MTPQFKFLRRVRIHGGECGAVARALHHEVKSSSLYQADLGMVPRSTHERKSMSTKTSLLKRIAQTAVVALVGGLLSIFAVPASNAATNTSITGSCVARAHLGGVIKVNANGDNTERIYAVQSAVTRSSESSTASTTPSTDLLQVTLETNTTSTGLLLSADTVTRAFASLTYIVWLDKTTNGTNATASGPGAATTAHAADPFTTVTCNVAGAPASYTLSGTSASVSANESATFTITPRDAAGNVTLLATNETITVTSSLTTAKITAGIEATNSDGLRLGTYLAGGNVPNARVVAGAGAGLGGVILTSNGIVSNGGVVNEVNGDTNTSVGSATARAIIYLGANKADGMSSGLVSQSGATTAKDTITATGAFTVNVTNTAAATTTFTVGGTGSVGMAGSATSTFTLTTLSYLFGTGFGAGSVAASGAQGADVTAGFNIIGANQKAPHNAPDATGTAASPAATGSGTVATSDQTWTVSTARAAVTVTWQLSGTSGTMPVTVAAVSTTSSTPAGITLGTTNLSVASESIASLTFTATAPADGQSYKLTWNKAANQPVTLTIVYEAPKVASGKGSVTVTPASGRALTGSEVTTTAVVRDQFRNLVSGATVLWTVTGRNATAAAVSATTDAAGKATYKFTDDATPATTLSDTVAATATTSGAGSYNAGSSAAYTWTASLAVTTLSMTNNAAAAGVAIDTDVTFTVTALGASGEALSGYPVVVTASEGGYFDSTSSSTTIYTGTNGTQTVVFDGRKAGTVTITATSGGKTATSTFTVLAGSARTIAVDAATASMAAGSSKRVTATVKDVYGNPVEDQAVTVSYVGTAGRVASVNGIASSTATTDASGQVVIEIASDAATGVGTGTLTVKFTGGSTSTVALNNDGSARPARVATATSAITITAADASVQNAAEAATDAALEAIDAANAATDAANLAAEAADAATVAAEEARDAADAATAAVEALASEVATLIAGLRAQITTLANTVAKIAKKVKA